MQRNDLDTNESYVRVKHGLYDWPANSRRDTQFVSPLLTQDHAKAMLTYMQDNDPKNKNAYTIVESRKVRTYDLIRYRVMVRLPKIEVKDNAILQTAIDMQTIRDFLNTYHPPLGRNRWRIVCDFRPGKTIGVGFEGPSLEYLEVGNEDDSLPVHESMMEEFSDEARKAGFTDSMIEKFKENLLTNDSRFGCFYNFKPEFLPELLVLAKQALADTNQITASRKM